MLFEPFSLNFLQEDDLKEAQKLSVWEIRQIIGKDLK